MPDATPEIFFSYSREDAELVLKIAAALRRDGRRVWVDQLDIAKGARWDEEVEKALQTSSCLLAVLSPAAVASKNVMDEVSYALGENKKVIPVLAKNCVIPFRLKRLQFVSFVDDYDRGYRELAAALDDRPAPPPGDTDVPRPASGRRTNQALVLLVAVLLTIAGYLAVSRPTSAPPAEASSTVKPPEAPQEAVDTRAPAAQPPPVAVKNVPAPAEAPVQPVPLAPVPMPPVDVAPPAPTRQVATDSQLRDFVRLYLHAQGHSSASELMSFYAEEVEYFDQRHATKAFILKDKVAYQRRWPELENQLVGPIEIDRSSGDGSALLSYTIRYSVRSPARGDSKSGTARDELRVRPIDGQLLIVEQRQRILNAQN